VRRVHDAIRIGITEGQTTDQIVRRIRGTRATKYKDGILEIALRDAAAVVNTAIAHTQNRAKMELYKANDDIVQGVQYVSVLDGRTTLLCASRDGKVYDIDKAPPIPAHWNCRSSYVPYLGIEGGKRASQFGQVPAKTTYEAFLRKQSVEFQNDVLGVTRAEKFRAGEKLDKFIDKSGRVYTLKELARLEKS
jgi:SPP1 gp7 family putative phage head morphogenesis protein